MTDQLIIALAQINPTVGDLSGNVERIRAAAKEATKGGADLVVYGELVVSGYPPEDLVLKPAFQDAVEELKQGAALEEEHGTIVTLDEESFAAAEGDVQGALKQLRVRKARAFQERAQATHRGLHLHARRAHANAARADASNNVR